MGLQVCFPFVASLLPLGQCLGAARGRQEEESGAAVGERMRSQKWNYSHYSLKSHSIMYYNGSILENDLIIIWNYNRIIPHEDGIRL